MNFIGLDIETAPTNGAPQEYALQPWRVLEGTAEITAIGISNKLNTTVNNTLRPSFSDDLTWLFEDCYVVTWNGVFDVAFLIAAGYDVRSVKWVDVMLLWKWISNSQHMEFRPKWSLADGAKRWLADWPLLEQFLKLKANAPDAGENDKYWELRCKMDALATRLIAEAIWPMMTPQQRRSALIEAACIWPVANSWVDGVKLNIELIDDLRPSVTSEMEDLEVQLELRNKGATWSPSKILRSPTQLRELLYETWNLPCERFTKPTAKHENGQKSTDKAALTYLSDKDDRMLDILRWRELNTQLTKFLDSPTKAKEYLGSNVVHPSPKLFSTYTGRMTYSSKTKKKYFTGIALHQMPRNKQLRKMVIV